MKMKVLASPSSIGQIAYDPFDILEANGYGKNDNVTEMVTSNSRIK